MTLTEFEILCGEALIEPSLALENEAIRKALTDRDDAKVKTLLMTEF